MEFLVCHPLHSVIEEPPGSVIAMRQEWLIIIDDLQRRSNLIAIISSRRLLRRGRFVRTGSQNGASQRREVSVPNPPSFCYCRATRFRHCDAPGMAYYY
jgi:hypothetical protein